MPVKNTAAQDGTGSRLTVNAVLEVIRAWISQNAGAGGTIKGADGGGDETFVMTTQLPSVGAESHMLGDWYVPISFSVTWQFISGGVVGNNVSLEIGTRVSSSGKINYQKVLLLDGGISRERVLDSTPRDGRRKFAVVYLGVWLYNHYVADEGGGRPLASPRVCRSSGARKGSDISR